jgi:hypothetical protein
MTSSYYSEKAKAKIFETAFQGGKLVAAVRRVSTYVYTAVVNLPFSEYTSNKEKIRSLHCSAIQMRASPVQDKSANQEITKFRFESEQLELLDYDMSDELGGNILLELVRALGSQKDKQLFDGRALNFEEKML